MVANSVASQLQGFQKSRLDHDRINRSTASVTAKLRIPNQDFGAT
jgi:hypothetical protein